MKQRKNTLWHKIIFTVFTASLIIGNLVLVMPTALAVGVDNVFTAEFNASGDIKNLLTLTFTNPVCGDQSCEIPVDKTDFTYIDGDSPTGFSAFSTCNHSAGSRYVICDMGEDATAADTADSVYVNPGAIWGVDGGVVSGSEEAVTLTATADTTGPTGVIYIDDGAHASNKIIVKFNEPVVDEGGDTIDSDDFAYVDVSGGNAGLISVGLGTILRPGGTNFVNLTLNAVLAAADNVDTLATVDNKIYDIYGNELTSPVPGFAEVLVITNDEVSENPTTAPTIMNAYAKAETGTGGIILVEFDYPITSASGATDALAALAVSDIQYGATPANVESVRPNAGDTIAIISDDTESALAIIDPASDASIYDPWTNAMVALDNQEQVDDVSNPVPVYVGINQYIDGCEEDESGATTGKGDTFGGLTDGEVTTTWGHLTAQFAVDYPQEGWGMYEVANTATYVNNDGFVVDLDHDIYDWTNSLYEFTQVQFDIYYEDNDSTAPYTDGDNDIAFYIDDDNTSLSDGDEVEWFIDTSLTGDLAEKTWTTITVDIDGTPDVGTLAGLASNPQYWGIKITDTPELDTLEADDSILIDNVKFIREATSKSNKLYVEYSEWVEGGTGDPVEGATAVASNTNIGDMTTSKTIAGLGAFETGTLTTKTLTNTISKETATLYNGSVYAITLADRAGGLITQASPVTLSATFTPIATVVDKDSNTIAAGSTVEATVGAALDLTTAATAVTDFTILSVGNGTLDLSWTPPTQTAATFSHYAALYGTSSGVTVASTLWDDTDDAALAGPTISTSSITGLTNATAYFVNLGGVDAKGNITSLVTEMSGTPSANSGGGGSSTGSGPGAPTSFTGSVDENMHVVLTWTDPANIDLESIQVIRSKGEGIEPGTVLATVNAGTEAYTDEDVAEGEVVNYQVRGKDNDGAFGTVTETLSLTIEAGATSVTPDVVEPTPTEEPAVEEPAAEEAAAEEAALAAGEGFTDTGDHWAETEILGMEGVGIATGYSDGSFDPDGQLNRAEAAALLYRILGFDEPSAPGEKPFPDVPVDQWYSGYISNMKALEMIHGYGDGLYRPGNDITRAEFIKIALEAFYYVTTDAELKSQIDDWMIGAKTISYSDLADSWYTPYVTTATNAGFISGYGCGTSVCFGADNNITRAEATVVLYNMFYSHFTAAIIEELVDTAAVAGDTAAGDTAV